MLYLIGLGITDERSITLESIEIAKKSECYLEGYTSKWKGSKENLEELIGKDITLIGRSEMEEDAQVLLDLAKEKDITIFVIGDPLSATTHVSMLLDAKKQNIEYKVIHNASIFTVIADTGLSLYNFGKTATIPSTEELENVKNTLENNKEIGLHTLLLLDIEMTNKQALEILLKKGILGENDKIISLHYPDQIYYKEIKELLELDISNPSVLIVPGKLNDIEKEFLL